MRGKVGEGGRRGKVGEGGGRDKVVERGGGGRVGRRAYFIHVEVLQKSSLSESLAAGTYCCLY